MPRWTDAARARQAELVRRWRPWDASTGPTTEQGRARSSRNADKGGDAGRAFRLAQAIDELSAAVAQVERLKKRHRAASSPMCGVVVTPPTTGVIAKG
jgi:hypothetical protein